MNKYLQKVSNWIKYWTNKVHIPRYKNVTLYNVGHFYLEAIHKGKIGHRSASISFRFLTALFPLCIFLFSIIPFIPIEGLQANLMLGLQKFFPDQIFDFFKDVLNELVNQKKTVLLSVGFLLSIYFASNAVDALITGLTESHHVNSKRVFWKQKLWSLGLLFIFFILFIFSFLITSIGQLAIDHYYDDGQIQGGFSYWAFVILKSALSVFVFMFSISILYNVANTDKVKWKFFNAGAIASTILILLLQQTFGLYITYFGKFDQIYGPIGTGLAFLLFIFYLFFLLIIGFELNTSLEKAYEYKNDPNKAKNKTVEEVKKQLNE
jgi:membrane protein